MTEAEARTVINRANHRDNAWEVGRAYYAEFTTAGARDRYTEAAVTLGGEVLGTGSYSLGQYEDLRKGQRATVFFATVVLR